MEFGERDSYEKLGSNLFSSTLTIILSLLNEMNLNIYIYRIKHRNGYAFHIEPWLTSFTSSFCSFFSSSSSSVVSFPFFFLIYFDAYQNAGAFDDEEYKKRIKPLFKVNFQNESIIQNEGWKDDYMFSFWNKISDVFDIQSNEERINEDIFANFKWEMPHAWWETKRKRKRKNKIKWEKRKCTVMDDGFDEALLPLLTTEKKKMCKTFFFWCTNGEHPTFFD